MSRRDASGVRTKAEDVSFARIATALLGEVHRIFCGLTEMKYAGCATNRVSPSGSASPSSGQACPAESPY